MKCQLVAPINRITALALCAVSLPLTAFAQQQCLKNAWTAFNQNDYQAAIRSADECIEDFGGRATKEQAALEARREKAPPTGAVENAADKKQIFDRWAVNDVSTAYFVKGRSAEYLFKKQRSEKYKQIAEQAYIAAARLSYGRCWDPQGFFWSPAEASSERLPPLK
jgi:hypothetical protein